MKKIVLSIIAVFCIGTLVANATDTISTKSTNNTKIKPKLEKMGTPPQDGNMTDRQAPSNEDLKGAQRPNQSPKQDPKQSPKQKPNKKPDGKPGGDRVPPEFMKNNS